MSESLRSYFLKGTALYGAGALAVRVLAFALVPVFTSYLSTSEYGLVSLAETIASVTSAIMMLALPAGVKRVYFNHSEEERALFSSTSLLLALALGTLAVASCLLAIPVLIETFSINFSVPFFPYLATAITTGVLVTILRVKLGLLQAEQRPLAYTGWFLGQYLLAAAISLVFVVGLGAEGKGLLYARCMAAGCLIAILYARFPWRQSQLFHGAIAKSLLVYSSPLIVHNVIALVVTLADRIFLEQYWGVDLVGQYSVAYTLGMTAAVLTQVGMQVWSPAFFRMAKKEGTQERLANVGGLMTALVCLAICVGALWSSSIYRLLTPVNYHEAAEVPALILGGYFFHYLFSLFNLSLLQAQKTMLISTLSVFAALLNVVLNFLWVPSLGMGGAAIATLLAYLLEASVIYWIAGRVFPVPYSKFKLLTMSILVVSVSFVSTAMDSLWVAAAMTLGVLTLLGLLMRREILSVVRTRAS